MQGYYFGSFTGTQKHNKRWFIQSLFNKVSLRLGLDILKIKQVTVKRPTLSKISTRIAGLPYHTEDSCKVSMENHLEENFKIVSDTISWETLCGGKFSSKKYFS